MTPWGGTQTNQVSSSYSKPHAGLPSARSTNRRHRFFSLVLRLLGTPAFRLLPAQPGPLDLPAGGARRERRGDPLLMRHAGQVGAGPGSAFDPELGGRPAQEFHQLGPRFRVAEGRPSGG